jgi:LacI family transcriptional regulator
MPKPRRVAVMLDLEVGYRRHLSVFAGAHSYAKVHDWELIIDEYADDTLPAKRGHDVVYDGVIARASIKLARRAARLRVPVVNVWFSSPARKLLPGVFPDFNACGRLRAEHLLSRGLSRFAVLVSNTSAARAETAAFCDVLTEARYGCDVTRVPLAPSSTLSQWRKTERIITATMNAWRPPIGVYIGGEDIGRLVAQMCRRRGWRVPEDVAIIAGYNEPAIVDPRPSLSSIELGGERVGYEAARLLDRMLDGEKAPRETLLPPEGLVVRESTDFFAVDDELIAEALAFISANSHRAIGADDVARAVSMETRTLQRRFRKVLDRPIATEIRRVRIERAKRELTQSKLSLAAIAHNVGFGPAMRMYEVFRRELGITPSEYRTQRRLERGD